MASVAYSKLGQRSAAKHFAQKALSGTPPLQELYRSGAMKIIEWAQSSKGSIDIEGKADTPSAPPPDVHTPPPPNFNKMKDNFKMEGKRKAEPMIPH